MTNLGENIRQIRKHFCITQTELARRACYSRTYIYYLEKGIRPIDENHIQIIARAIGVKPLAIYQPSLIIKVTNLN